MLEFISIRHKHMKIFKTTASELLSRSSSNIIPVKNIVAVGARYNSAEGFADRDKVWLQSTLELCEMTNIPLHSDAKVIPVNMTNGHDILDPSLKINADVLVSCFIINPKLAFDWDIAKLKHEHGTGYNVSTRHSPGAWSAAARRTGARLIVTFNRNREIDSGEFEASGFIKGPEATVILPYIDPVFPNKLLGNEYKMETVFRADLAMDILQQRVAQDRKEAIFG